MQRRRPVLASLLALGLLASCSSGGERATPPGPTGPGTTEPRIDLDPEAYVTGYEESSADYGPTAGSPTSPGSATVDASESEGSPQPPPEMPPDPPTLNEDNTFVEAGDQPFVATADQASSTFGLDVDTGSFSVGRTFLTEGQRPPTESVRTEEWVNALGSGQASPANGDLGVRVDGAIAPFTDDGTVLVRVGVSGRDVAAADRPPAHLTFVIDTSGSMDIRERLGLVKASLGLLVLHLRDDDTISLVTYDSEAGVTLEPTPVSDAETIVAAIDALEPGNSTNLEAGLRAGYDQAERTFDPGAINAVILASDGVANVGLTDPDGLGGIIQDRAEEGVHLVTVGYGMGNYNDDLMEQVADQGDGFYAYLDTYQQAERLFRDRLTSTLAVVAGDAKAQVQFDPALVSAHRLLGYENRALAEEDFDDATVDAGEVGAGHRVTALYELRLATLDAPPAAAAVLGTAAVRYRSVASGEEVTVEEAITYGTVSGTFEAAAPDLRLQAATAAFAEWLGEAPVSIERGLDVATIRAVAAAASADLPAEGLAGSVLTPAELLELLDLAAVAGPPVEAPIGE